MKAVLIQLQEICIDQFEILQKNNDKTDWVIASLTKTLIMKKKNFSTLCSALKNLLKPLIKLYIEL